MPLAAGLAGQLGIANESTPNSVVAANTFTAFNTEGLEARPNMVQGKGIEAGGLVPDANRRQITSQDAGGPVNFNLPTKGIGKWLAAATGDYTATMVQIASTTAYQGIFNTKSPDGKTFTCQVGVPSTDGTVNPKTLGGCKITDWTVTSAPNAIATFDATIDAMSIAPTGSGALGLQTASYSAATSEYTFLNLTVQTFSAYTTVSGLITPTSPVTLGVVRNASLKGGQPKDTARWGQGSATKQEALVNDYQPITGQFDLEFASMAVYNQMVASTQFGLVLTFTGGLAGVGNNYTLQFIMPACFWEVGATPKIGGPGLVVPQPPFTALKDASGNALQVNYISTDTTI